MKKILFMIDTLEGGGAEKVLFDILKNLDKRKYKIDVLLLENRGIYLEEILKLGVNVHWLFNIKKNYKNFIVRKTIKLIKAIYLFFPRLIKNISRNEYDVEIAFLEGNTTILLSNIKSKAKKISWVHIDLKKTRFINKNLEQKINSYLERKAYKKIEKIICVSEQVKESFGEIYPELKDKTKVIYNPINKNEIILKADEDMNDSLNLGIKIMSIGRLVKQKGYDILLQAHKELLDEGLNYTLYILGEGSERKKLEKYIKLNELEENTKLLGFKKNPYYYLKQADIFVSSSRNEGYPLVLCEAICLSKPIIATYCTGPIEILENGKYGLMSMPEDIKGLKRNLKKMILNKEIQNKYSKLSMKCSEKFDIKKQMKEIEELL